jgi:hypothetical protein
VSGFGFSWSGGEELEKKRTEKGGKKKQIMANTFDFAEQGRSMLRPCVSEF